MSNFVSGKIESSLIGNYSDIEYSPRRQFPDDATVNHWKDLGHLYVNYTGYLREQYKGLPDWCFNILDVVSEKHNLKNGTMCLYYMPPGTIMPEHRDTYKRYKELNELNPSSTNICRLIVFLNDWESGHYFEVADSPAVNWKSGEYIMWDYDTPHIAANIGRTNRYTLQITAEK